MEVDKNKYDIQAFNYSDSLIKLEWNDRLRGPELAKHILLQKQSAWSYEDEERLFVQGGKEYAEVKVREVILGSRMSNQNRGFIRNLISKINSYINVLAL